MNPVFSRLISFTILALIAACAVGCHHDDDFRRFDTITVSLDPQFRDANGNPVRVQVDLIPVNEAGVAGYKSDSVANYFDQNVNVPLSLKWTLEVGHTSQSISINDPDPAKKAEAVKLWDEWEKKKFKYLVVLSDYPPPPAGTAPDKDWRRLVLPLMWGNWSPDDKDISIMVTSRGLSPQTSPKSMAGN